MHRAALNNRKYSNSNASVQTGSDTLQRVPGRVPSPRVRSLTILTEQRVPAGGRIQGSDPIGFKSAFSSGVSHLDRSGGVHGGVGAGIYVPGVNDRVRSTAG